MHRHQDRGGSDHRSASRAVPPTVAARTRMSLRPEFGWITGNLSDLSKGYFATTFLSSSLTCPARQSGLCGLCSRDRISVALGLEERVGSSCCRVNNDGNGPPPKGGRSFANKSFLATG